MDPAERHSLLAHLQEQVITLNTTVGQAVTHPAPAQLLADVRDQVFCIQETLGTLEVPHALVSRDEWIRLPRP